MTSHTSPGIQPMQHTAQPVLARLSVSFYAWTSSRAIKQTNNILATVDVILGKHKSGQNWFQILSMFLVVPEILFEKYLLIKIKGCSGIFYTLSRSRNIL